MNLIRLVLITIFLAGCAALNDYATVTHYYTCPFCPPEKPQ